MDEALIEYFENRAAIKTVVMESAPRDIAELIVEFMLAIELCTPPEEIS